MVLEQVNEEELARIIINLPEKRFNDVNITSVLIIQKWFKHNLNPHKKLNNIPFHTGGFSSLLNVAKVI